MHCRQCQADNPDASRFCDACGASLALVCGACGTACRAGARFCGQCGTGLSSEPPLSNGPPQLAPASMPSPLLRHIEEGERKQVTVLFADIRGSTALIDAMDPELAMGLLDPAVQAMVGAVQRFGGTVNRIQGDGIMALFGAPVASEDHAIRACLSGQAILAAVAALHEALQVRVGLNSGEVVIRSVGNDPSDYDAVGVTVHVAHRMEQLAAPGSVCLTGRTALLAHGTVDLEPLGARDIAGIAEKVTVFRLISAHERPAWDVRAAAGTMAGFVGREAEMRQLEAALSRAGLGRGQVVTLTADAGIGKSRLVHEFLKRLPVGGWSVIRTAAMGHGEGTPYRLAADVLRAWLGVDRADGRAAVARKLEQALTLLSMTDPADASPLESLLDLPVREPGWAELAADIRLARMLPALRLAMLRESAIRPLVLLLEDLHWADPQSEALIEALVDGMGGARVLLLVTTRPERRPSWATRGNRSYCIGMHLGPLEPAAAESLLFELLGRGPELAELRARIVAQADGTPLFIEELARALIEQGVVVYEPPSLRLTRQATDIQLPASVQAILATRIDQLGPEQRRLLQVAAVIGKDVPHDILAATADLSDLLLATYLAELQAAEFIYMVARAAGTDYTFKHALTQAVTYEGMLRRQRRDLHGRVLHVIEAQAADRAEELTEVLADHALRGEVWDRAASLAAKAGRRANSRSAWHEAIHFYDHAQVALSHVPEAPDVLAQGIDIRLGLRQALPPTAQLDRAVAAIDEASSLAERLGDLARISHIDTSRCLLLSILGDLERAVLAGASGLQAALAMGDPAATVNAAYALGQAHWFRGEFDDAARVMEASLALAHGPMRLHNTGTSGTASVLLTVCLSKNHALLGGFAAAEALAAEALAIAEETGKPYDLTYAHLAAGFAALVAGDPTRAVVSLELALQRCRAGGVALLVPSVARYLGRAYAQVGRLPDAHRLLDEAMETSASSRMIVLTVWCGLAQGHAHLHGGGHDMAREQLLETLALARTHGYRPVEAQLLRLLGESHLATGEQAAAAGYLGEAEALASELGMAPELAAVQALRLHAR